MLIKKYLIFDEFGQTRQSNFGRRILMKRYSIIIAVLLAAVFAVAVNAEINYTPQTYDKTSPHSTYCDGNTPSTDLNALLSQIGCKVYTQYTYVTGKAGDTPKPEQDPDRLWDGNTDTKFNPYPIWSDTTVWSVAKTYEPISINGIVMATADDNKKEGRLPEEWAIFVSSDGQTWTQYAYGTSTFFAAKDETAENKTYYGFSSSVYTNVNYIAFQATGATCENDYSFQLSVVAVCVCEPTAEGQCGDNAYWSYNKDTKTLMISGTGDMWDYGDTEEKLPGWSTIELRI